MPRFYCPQPLELNVLLSLPDAIAHHIQVLRLKEGEVITLFNGEGGEYAASIEHIEKKRVEVRLKTFSAREAEPAHALALAQVLPEGSKMDWIMEKAVELGATSIQPLLSERSVIRLNAERATKKMSHWQGVLAAASEQCGRNRLPHLSEPLPFLSWIAPEGGLTPVEEQAAITHGALCLTMGERVLRTETAGLAAIAALQSIWDEL